MHDTTRSGCPNLHPTTTNQLNHAGNDYSIKNISNKDARIFFCQGRKVLSGEVEDHSHGSLLPSFRFLHRPSSKVSLLLAWLLPRLIARFTRFRYEALVWCKDTLPQYARFASGRRLYFLFFLLGLALRRLPFIGSPPLVNIQIVRVV